MTAGGTALLGLDEVDSTNEEARRRAEAGEPGPLWITAARQTAGRGRRGRAWQMPDGNLAATLLLRSGEDAGQLSFVAALAVADLAAHFAPDANITVKWPNDVLANERKLAGILLEAGQRPAPWLAIGIGVNLIAFPPDTEFPATAIAALGVVPPTRDAALVVLMDRFAHWHRTWREKGFAPLRAAWLARAQGLGAPIRARLSHEERRGVFEGIDATGALLLREGTGVSAIAAAEVFF